MSAFTPQQLASEINTDPKGLGLVALKNAGNRIGIANVLNATYAGVTAVFRNDVSSADLLAAIVWSEVSAFTATQWSAIAAMLSPPILDGTNANVRAFFSGLFVGKTQTLANLTAAAQKAGTTRAEELWGYGVHVTEQDVAGAIG